MARGFEPEPMDELNVVPIIDVNLVLLAILIILASHGAKLLPMALPKAEKTQYVESATAVPLRVGEDGTYRLGDSAGLTTEAVASRLALLPEGTTVWLQMDPKARYARLVPIVDELVARPALRLAFASTPESAPAAPAAAPH